ncbi:hypothetical protein RUND412_001584, partial [Rhizina undulata]
MPSIPPSIFAQNRQWVKRGRKTYTTPASRSVREDNGTIWSANVSKETRDSSVSSYHDLETDR